MSKVVNAIIGTALDAAMRRGTPKDVALGLIAGLRQIRFAADEAAGFTAASAIDGAIQAQIISDGLTAMRRTGVQPKSVHLPQPGVSTSNVAAIFEGAADACLAVNAHAEDNEPLHYAVLVMASQLVLQLGGTPNWGELQAELHRHHEPHSPIPVPVLPTEGTTIH